MGLWGLFEEGGVLVREGATETEKEACPPAENGPEKADSADKKADRKKVPSNKMPENPKVTELGERLRNCPKGKRLIGVARDLAVEIIDAMHADPNYTGKFPNIETLAQTLLREVRRFPHLYKD